MVILKRKSNGTIGIKIGNAFCNKINVVIDFFHKRINEIRTNMVIGIKKTNIVTCSSFYTCNISGQQSAVFLTNYFDTRVIAFKSSKDFKAVVSRAIVNSNYFYIAVILA